MSFSGTSAQRAFSTAVVIVGLLTVVFISVSSAGGAVVASDSGTDTTQASGTLTVDVSTGSGAIDTYVEVEQNGERVASGNTGDDGEISFDVDAGNYTVTAHEANEISKEVSVLTGSTTPVTLTFATLEIDADSGYGEIESYSNVDTADGEYITGKSIPDDGVATYHLDPGTYQAIAIEDNEVSKDVSLTAGVTTPVTLTFATLEIDADSGYGRIESYSNVDTVDGEYITGKSIPGDGVATYHLDPGTYQAIAIEDNEVSEDVSLTAGVTTPVTLTFATLEIDADSGYGEIESYSNVDTADGEYITGKSIPGDGVATYHLDPGTYQAIAIEDNEVSKDVSLTAGVTTPANLTFGTVEIDAEVGNQQIESYSNVDTADGEYITGKSIPGDGVATYHLNPGTYRAIAIEDNEISREVSVVADQTRSVGATFASLNVSATAGNAYASVETTDGEYITGKSVPADGGAEFHLASDAYQLEVADDDSDVSLSDTVSLSSTVQTFATAQFGAGTITVRTEELASANFEFADLTLSTTEIPVGASLSASATVTNTGDSPGEYTARFRLDDEVVETQRGTLGVDEQTTVTFSTVMDTAGVYDVTIGNLSSRTVTVGDGGTDGSEPTVEPGFTTTPDSPTAGETVTFDASNTTVSDGTVESYEWDFTSDGTVDATGEAVEHSFEQSGNYTVSLIVTAGAGVERTVSESITVTDSQTVVRLAPTSQTTNVGGTVQYDVVVDGYDRGIDSYQFDVDVDTASTATVTAVTLQGTAPDDPLTAVEYTSDNTSVSVSAGVAGHDSGVIATISVTGRAVGTTALTLGNPIVGDSNSTSYAIDAVENGTLAVDNAPAVVGDAVAQDLDSDKRYEDINGDGSFDIVDVSAFFQNRQAQSVQRNSSLFDFNGDGAVDIVDVSQLFSLAQQ